MVKTASSVVFFILGVCLVSCCRDKTERLMDTAESLLDSQPDSSLVILESLSTADFKGDNQRARYSLLYSKALDKNYIDIASDSLILPALNYYGDKENEESMMAWYYNGVVHKNAHDYMPAMVSFDESQRIAEKTGNYHYQGLSLRAKAGILSESFDIDNSISTYCSAIDAFTRAGDEVYSDYARLSLALALQNNLRFDEEREVLLELMHKDSLDAPLLSQVYRTYAASLLLSHPPQVDSALLYYQLASESPYAQPFRAYDIIHLAYAYELSGENELADQMIQAAEKWPLSDGVQGLHHGQYMIYLHRGQYEKALHSLEESLRDQTEDINQKLKQSVTYGLSEHYGRLAEKRQEEMRRRSRLWVLCFMGVLSLCAYFFIRNRKKQRQVVRLFSETLMVSDELELVKEKNAMIADILSGLVEERISAIRDLAGKFFLYNNKDEEWLRDKKGVATKEELLSAFRHDLASLRSDHSLIDALEARINLMTDHLFDGIRVAISREENRRKKRVLDKSDYDILILSLSGFPVMTICYLTGKPDYIISERLYRYKTKLAFLSEKERLFLFSKEFRQQAMGEC